VDGQRIYSEPFALIAGETINMTTPKAEAMAREIAEKYFDRHSKSAVALAKELLPLLSAEKERDELKANRQYETDLVATLTSERDELKAILELLPFDILDKEESGNLDAADFVDNSNATINVLRLARAFLAKQGEK
jgi:glutamate synthase domain-containing protein 2